MCQKEKIHWMFLQGIKNTVIIKYLSFVQCLTETAEKNYNILKAHFWNKNDKLEKTVFLAVPNI